jgi:hypothetical protein
MVIDLNCVYYKGHFAVSKNWNLCRLLRISLRIPIRYLLKLRAALAVAACDQGATLEQKF